MVFTADVRVKLLKQEIIKSEWLP